MTYWELLLDTTINPIEWTENSLKDRLELVLTEQVGLIYGKLFRIILKKVCRENTWKYDRIHVFAIEVSLIANR